MNLTVVLVVIGLAGTAGAAIAWVLARRPGGAPAPSGHDAVAAAIAAVRADATVERREYIF